MDPSYPSAIRRATRARLSGYLRRRDPSGLPLAALFLPFRTVSRRHHTHPGLGHKHCFAPQPTQALDIQLMMFFRLLSQVNYSSISSAAIFSNTQKTACSRSLDRASSSIFFKIFKTSSLPRENCLAMGQEISNRTVGTFGEQFVGWAMGRGARPAESEYSISAPSPRGGRGPAGCPACPFLWTSLRAPPRVPPRPWAQPARVPRSSPGCAIDFVHGRRA